MEAQFAHTEEAGFFVPVFLEGIDYVLPVQRHPDNQISAVVKKVDPAVGADVWIYIGIQKIAVLYFFVFFIELAQPPPSTQPASIVTFATRIELSPRQQEM